MIVVTCVSAGASVLAVESKSDRGRTTSSGIGWAKFFATGNVKAEPGVRQAAAGLLMTSVTEATRTK
jgi:hypothetical protein